MPRSKMGFRFGTSADVAADHRGCPRDAELGGLRGRSRSRPREAGFCRRSPRRSHSAPPQRWAGWLRAEDYANATPRAPRKAARWDAGARRHCRSTITGAILKLTESEVRYEEVLVGKECVR